MIQQHTEQHVEQNIFLRTEHRTKQGAIAVEQKNVLTKQRSSIEHNIEHLTGIKQNNTQNSNNALNANSVFRTSNSVFRHP